MRSLTLPQARRIALAAQGLAGPRPAGRVDVRHFRRVIGRLHVIQLDSVIVAVRAHYMPFFSRLGSYDRDRLDEWINGPEVFEYWGHEASFMSTDDYSLLRYRMKDMEPWGRALKLLADNPRYIDSIYREVARKGPLTVSDLDNPGSRTGPWWGYHNGKTALEWLNAAGRITTRGRDYTFKSVYDLSSRAIPAEARQHRFGRAEAQRRLLLKAAQAHGVGTAADLADYYRIRVPEARPLLEKLAASGRLQEVTVQGWKDQAYLHPDAVLPRRVTGARLLSPFDSLIWARPRVSRLFGFDYRIEIYVPKPQRQYGYYVYPFLLDGELVGRVDLKADRKAGLLRAPGAFVEPGRPVERVAGELAVELKLMAGWLGLDGVAVGRRGNLATDLRRRIRS